MKTKQRILELDLLRGLAIIMMVLGHSFIVQPVDIHNVSWCKALEWWIYTYHMELFFLISGCVYKCVEYKGYIKKKTERILVPYFFIGLITALLHSSPIGAINRHTSLSEGLINLFFYGGNFWFLYTLFFIFLLFPLIDRYITKRVWLLPIIILCILVKPKMPLVLCIKDVVNYLPYFTLGVFIRPNLQSFFNLNSLKQFIIIVFCILGYVLMSNIDVNLLGFNRFIRTLLMCIALASVSVLFSKLKLFFEPIHKAISGLLVNSSIFSLQIYLFNGFCLVALRVLICTVMHITNPILIVTGLVVGNLVISISLCKYLLPKSKLLSYLCGLK